MLTFEAIMETIEKEDMGAIIKNCAKSSVEEAKAAIRTHPKQEMQITETKDARTCIAICPRDYHPDEAVKAAGIAGLFKRRKR